jgi:probable phosphoglycerate mutase
VAGTRLLIAVRHGRTDWNANGRFQGQADPALDVTGLCQAAEVARRVCLVVDASASDHAAVVVASDLRRAAATGECIASALGTPLVLDPRLREVDLSRWEGLYHPQAERLFPKEWAAWTSGRDVRRGGGETEREAGARVATAVEALLSLDNHRPAGPLVVVGHGLSLRSALGWLRDHGLIDFTGAAPHLGNGHFLALQAQARPAPHSGNRVPMI